MNRYHFSDEFELVYANSVYYVYVEGYKEPDENDPYVFCVEFQKIEIFDEERNQITKFDPDYDDLIEEIYSREYDISFESEAIEYDDESYL